MKLTTRFVILTGILGLAAIVSLGVAYWGTATVDRGVRSTYGDITAILASLEAIKRDFESQTQDLQRERSRFRAILEERDPDAPPPADFIEEHGRLDASSINRRSQSIAAEIEALRRHPAFRRYAGMQRSSLIGERVHALRSLIDACVDAHRKNEPHGFAQAVVDAHEVFERLHLMIEHLEGRMLEDLKLSIDNSGVIRRQVNAVFLASLLVAALVIVLVLLLQRRWFNQPILALREATIELSRGHFEHRIPIDTHDELGQLSREVNEMAGTIVEMQQKLIERERLAAIGEMMRRIVHNLRNPLAGIRSLAELTRSELPSDSDERENQDRIVATVDRFERWLEEVLHTTRPLEVRPEPGSPGAFLRGVIEPQQATAAGKHVDLVLDLDAAPDSAPFDARHLQHAVVALVANAIEASPSGGTVRVIGGRPEPAPSGNGRMDGASAPPRTVWHLISEDSGPGIDPEVRDRIFEPYFTTKRHGTGIGLAVVRNVVQAHGGRIAVEGSELGGARFEVTLPC